MRNVGISVALKVGFAIGVVGQGVAWSAPAWQDISKKAQLNKNTLEVFSKTFDSPWSVEPVSKTFALVSQKGGEIFLVDLVAGKSRLLAEITESQIRGQGGLLDLAVERESPSGEVKRVFAVGVVREKREFTVALWAANGSGLSHKKKSQLRFKKIFTARAHGAGGRHFGSRIALAPGNKLFLSIGDRGQRQEAQNLNNHIGTILRLNRDGTVPQDNPFVGQAKAQPEIWSFGHRNPQGLWWDQRNKKLWSNEHGPQGGDEINGILKGKNYGWPKVTHGEEYGGGHIAPKKRAGFEDPLYAFVPSIAPSALVRLGSQFGSAWNGSFLSTALVLQHVNRLFRSGGGSWKEERLLGSLQERFRDVQVSTQGDLYFVTDAGSLMRMRSSSSD